MTETPRHPEEGSAIPHPEDDSPIPHPEDDLPIPHPEEGDARLEGSRTVGRGGRLADGEWHRMHPASPLLKGGIALIAILGVVIANMRERILDMFLPQFMSQEDPFDYVIESGLIGWVLLATGGVLIVLIAGFYISWRMHMFRITDEIVEVRSGILFRTNRKARLDRIQGINIVRPLFARLFGAAKLEINQAGQDANVQLSYLGSAASDDLRREILRLASGTHESSTATSTPALDGSVIERRVSEFLAPELDPNAAPPQSIVKLHLGRLIGSLVLSTTTIVMLILIVAAIVWVTVTGEFVVLLLFIPAAIGFGGFYVNRFTKSLRYSIAGTPDGIRVGFGLLSTSNETLPPGRIHSVQVSQPLLWRGPGWWEIKVNRASHSSTKGAGGDANTTILPVGDRDDVRKVLELMLPELRCEAAEDEPAEVAAAGGAAAEGDAVRHPAVEEDAAEGNAAQVDAAEVAATSTAFPESDQAVRVIEAGLESGGREGDGFTNSPRRAAVLRWFSWRRNGFAITPGSLVLRKGAIWRQLVIVPQPRLQSVSVHQGPLLRALRLATVHLHTVSGPINADLGAVDRDAAVQFFEDVARVAVSAAQSDTTHRWRAGEQPA